MIPQPGSGRDVPFLISCNLGIPKGPVFFGDMAALDATMPETSIEKYHNTFIRKEKIRSTFNRYNVGPPTGKASGYQGPSKP